MVGKDQEVLGNTSLVCLAVKEKALEPVYIEVLSLLTFRIQVVSDRTLNK